MKGETTSLKCKYYIVYWPLDRPSTTSRTIGATQ